MFDWNDLRHFLAVARHGSTISAAKAMCLSQSTVHRRLAELEARRGRHILIRHATGYRLTEFGEELRPLAERVEEAIATIERHLTAKDDTLTGLLRVTSSESIGYRLTKSQVLDVFHARYPKLKVQLIMSDRFLHLGKGEAEVAIRAGMPDDETLVGRKIADVPWALYASRSYIERYGRAERVELINQHAVIEFDGDIKEHHAARWLRSVAPQATVAARSNSVSGLLMMVRSGAGLAPLPVPLAAREPELVRVLGQAPAAGPVFTDLSAHSPRLAACAAR